MGRTLRRLSSCVVGGAAIACLVATSAAAAPNLPIGNPPQLPPPTAAPSSRPDFVPGELIVRFKPGTAASERSALNAAQGASVRRGLLVPRAYLLKLPKDRDIRAAQRAYERNPNVQYAEPNGIGELMLTPSEPAFPQQWALNNTGQTINGITGTADADIDAPEAWDSTVGSGIVTVGVVDTGVAYNHGDLTGRIWVNAGEFGSGKETNNVDDDGNGKVDDWRGWDFYDNDKDPNDDVGHGTHVAGIIGAKQGNGGIVGINWDVRIAPLRVCSANPLVPCTSAAMADAFAYAGQKGMNVVNGSLGGFAFSQVAADAIANSPNTLFVFSAGNGGSDGVGDNNDTTPEYPCQYPAPNIICVAATDQNDNKASFSNYGLAGVDLAAPGTNVLSSYTINEMFRDNFEVNNFATNWTTGGFNNTWARVCAGGNCAMTDSPAGNYGNTDSFSRTTNAISTTGRTGCRPQFLFYWDLANDGVDTAFIDASTDGVNWGLPNLAMSFGGNSGGWQWMDVNAGGTMDNKPSIYLRWRLLANTPDVSDGVYTDQVVIRCDPVASPGDFAYASGTSQASPMVAGAAALAFAKVPGARPLGVKDAILNGVDKKASLNGLVATGGRLNLVGMLTRLACCHVRPIGATPFVAALVPAYNQCTSPNRVHGPPDLPGGTNPDGSCAPPVQRSTQLTVGTPDANGPAANSIGSLRMDTIVGNPGTPADEADVSLKFNLTDVRVKTGGIPDYSGQLEARTTLRVTDRRSGPSANEAGTIQDVPFEFTVPCVTTADTSIGSTCSLTTSGDALSPGIAAEGAREVWQLSQVQVADGGADGVASTEPNTIFAVQGLFVP